MSAPYSKDPMLVGGSSCAWALSAAITRMDTCGLIMPPADAQFVGDHIRLCLQHWQAMRDKCVASGVKRWKFRPKHHYLEHVGETVVRTQLNPRHFACFNDESFLGATKKSCNAVPLKNHFVAHVAAHNPWPGAKVRGKATAQRRTATTSVRNDAGKVCLQTTCKDYTAFIDFYSIL